VLGLTAAVAGVALAVWSLGGGPGRLLRAKPSSPRAPTSSLTPGLLVTAAGQAARGIWDWRPVLGVALVQALALLAAGALTTMLLTRAAARRRRRYVRLRVEPYRGDHADADALVRMFESLHKRLLRRWWRRALTGQPSLALEVHYGGDRGAHDAWLAVTAPAGFERIV